MIEEWTRIDFLKNYPSTAADFWFKNKKFIHFYVYACLKIEFSFRIESVSLLDVQIFDSPPTI